MRSLNTPKILIIEDHHATLEAIKMIFEFEGYTVLGLTSTIDLHSEVANFAPDVILIDVLLNTTDGRSICTELKLSVHAAIPILLMSSRNGFQHNSYYKAHWDDYIEKPFEMEIIIQRVKMLMRQEKH
ncbi:response regulator transcription factor [Pedobacter jeongneungensis]|uniref:response regulator transcription factor n=1 Tax=Pedobacter jeongneungensis TaxID=947309 RepID=UPI00046A7AAA|nr:response regulator [Pedobacter jeongneungensis]